MRFNGINSQVISIDGNIGSGKSTLLGKLKEYYAYNDHVVFLKEPVDDWEKITDENGITMLEKFYSNQEKYSFSFQMMAYISRLKVLKDTKKMIIGSYLNGSANSSKPYIIITERSLYTDKMVFAKMLYDSKKIEEVNYKIYLSWFDTFSEEFPVDKIIYVKTSPEKCHSRILKRSRDGEANIPLEYLNNCHKYHDDMLDTSLEECVCKNQLILDGNVNIYENANQIEQWIQEIDNFIKK
jgi:deoxyadenosine/deoxycytidine kinase